MAETPHGTDADSGTRRWRDAFAAGRGTALSQGGPPPCSEFPQPAEPSSTPTVRLRRENVLPPFLGGRTGHGRRFHRLFVILRSRRDAPEGSPALRGAPLTTGQRTQKTASGEAGQGSFRAGRRARAVCTPIPPCGVAPLGRLSLGRLGRGPRARRPRHVRGRPVLTRPAACTGTSPVGLLLWPHGMTARP